MYTEVRLKVSGRVQFVMYRDFVARKARSLRLGGTVRNLSDGTVEVVAQGDTAKLRQFIEKLRQGSLLSRVDTVEVVYCEPKEKISNFKIVYA